VQNPTSRIEAFAITVYKKNVEDHIRRDANKLYNYMTSLVLLDRIKDKPILWSRLTAPGALARTCRNYRGPPKPPDRFIYSELKTDKKEKIGTEDMP